MNDSHVRRHSQSGPGPNQPQCRHGATEHSLAFNALSTVDKICGLAKFQPKKRPQKFPWAVRHNLAANRANCEELKLGTCCLGAMGFWPTGISFHRWINKFVICIFVLIHCDLGVYFEIPGWHHSKPGQAPWPPVEGDPWLTIADRGTQKFGSSWQFLVSLCNLSSYIGRTSHMHEGMFAKSLVTSLSNCYVCWETGWTKMVFLVSMIQDLANQLKPAVSTNQLTSSEFKNKHWFGAKQIWPAPLSGAGWWSKYNHWRHHTNASEWSSKEATGNSECSDHKHLSTHSRMSHIIVSVSWKAGPIHREGQNFGKRFFWASFNFFWAWTIFMDFTLIFWKWLPFFWTCAPPARPARPPAGPPSPNHAPFG